MPITREKTYSVIRDGESLELTSDQEEELDRIVDTMGCSYDDARRKMGLPVDVTQKRLEILLRGCLHLEKLAKSLCKDFSAAIVVGI